MLVETGFETQYVVKNIRSIKAVNSGDFQGNKYGASVQFKTINIEQKEDDLMGTVEKEIILIIKVSCEDREIKAFNQWLRDHMKAHKALAITGSIPRESGKDTYTVTSYVSASELMATPTDKK